MKTMCPTVYFVIPCYNEQEVLPETSRRLIEKIETHIKNGILSDKTRIVFVDDGSKDTTWQIINDLHEKSSLCSGIKLSGNKGHQNALLCGLMTVKDLADCVISLDADLQDDINAIDEMIEKFCAGCDIVYGVRSERKTDSFFKRFTAESFYKMVNSLGGNLIYNHADYRLMSKRSLDALSNYREVNLFLRGIIPMIGFKTDIVYYERSERFAGESKYPLKKMLAFAFEGITSLSTKPIRMITALGFFIFLVSLGMLGFFIYRHFAGRTIIGWSSIAVSVWAIGGLILLSIGVVGEYIGKIYLETKDRPRFIVEEFINE
ncbi:MAG: glycosyltransferase family 2 protein [Treponemataceae bacterium]